MATHGFNRHWRRGYGTKDLAPMWHRKHGGAAGAARLCVSPDVYPYTDALSHAVPGGPPEGGGAVGTGTERSSPHDPRLRLPVCPGVRGPGGRRPMAPFRADAGHRLAHESRRQDVDIQPPEGRPVALWLGRIHRQGRRPYLATPCA